MPEPLVLSTVWVVVEGHPDGVSIPIAAWSSEAEAQADVDARGVCFECHEVNLLEMWREPDLSVVRADETQGDTDDRGHMPTR